jgi:hypothetical protein
MKTQHQAAILLIGICLCAICALFPPRRLVGGNYPPSIKPADITHAMLFSGDFTFFVKTHNDGGTESWPVELDTGSLLAELVLIVSLTGIIILVPRLKI